MIRTDCLHGFVCKRSMGLVVSRSRSWGAPLPQGQTNDGKPTKEIPSCGLI